MAHSQPGRLGGIRRILSRKAGICYTDSGSGRCLAVMADTGRPVKIVTPKGEYELQVNPSAEMMRESFLERRDPGFICVGKIRYSELTGNPPFTEGSVPVATLPGD